MRDFIDKLLPFENDLFLALNGGTSVFWKNAMWTYTGLVTWIPMVLFILYIAFRNQQVKEGLLVLGSILLILVLANVITELFFKPYFQRSRPSHHTDYKDIVIILNDFRGGDYGFISGHATNSFGFAFFFSRSFKNRFVTFSMMFWATLNSYSRVYLGVHFISDIVAGFIIGTLIGILVYKLYVWMRVRYFRIPTSDSRKTIYSEKMGNMLGIVILTYIALVILLSPLLSTFSHSIIPESWF